MYSIDWTHFLAVPLNHERSFAERINSFYSELSTKFNNPTAIAKGFHPSILVPIPRLHFTVCMLKLVSKESQQQAVEVLKKCSSRIYDMLKTRTLMVRLEGLEIMNDDPQMVDVLYIKLKEVGNEGRLSQICGNNT